MNPEIKKLLLTTLWGDVESLTLDAAFASPFRSRELFRVTAPMPTTWRLWARVSSDRPGNLPMLPIFRLLTGTGRSNFNIPITVPMGQRLDIVVPGLTFSGFFDMPVPLNVPSLFTFEAWIAPEVPWAGLKVELLE